MTSGSVIGGELRVVAQPDASDAAVPNVRTLRHCIAIISSSKGRGRQILHRRAGGVAVRRSERVMM
jgi:hypothetical protein